MWNFNNGQLLQKMKVSSARDVMQVVYVESRSEKYIASVGWDNKISLFLDEPGNFLSVPKKELDGTFMGERHGHVDDVLTICYDKSRGVLATGSVDGTIIIWNVRSGHVKRKFSAPNIEDHAPAERAVEKVHISFSRLNTYCS